MCDDVFDEDADDLTVINREYLKLTTNIEKEGFRDGLENGTDSNIQKAFDFGYNKTFKFFRTINIIKGILSVMKFNLVYDQFNQDLDESFKLLKKIEVKLEEDFINLKTKNIDECISNFNQVKLTLFNICQKLNYYSLIEVIQQCELNIN
jgi:PREDICTED: hypothetical protein